MTMEKLFIIKEGKFARKCKAKWSKTHVVEVIIKNKGNWSLKEREGQPNGNSRKKRIY